MLNTRQIISYIFSFVLILCLASCGGKSTKKVVPHEDTSNVQHYVLFVQGVECKFCAQTVLDLLHKQPGMKTAQYHTTDDTYQDSYVSFSFDHTAGQLPIEHLKEQLTHEGFTFAGTKNRSSDTVGYPMSGSTLKL